MFTFRPAKKLLSLFIYSISLGRHFKTLSFLYGDLITEIFVLLHSIILLIIEFFCVFMQGDSPFLKIKCYVKKT